MPRTGAPISAGVSETLGAAAYKGRLADNEEERISWFVGAAVADADRSIGEVVMLAVDPADQRHGIRRALTGHATAWLRDNGIAWR
jgi:GNAT superfamily N-acetyltransferase